MELNNLNSLLSDLFNRKIRLVRLVDQTTKKWYEKQYKSEQGECFEVSVIYGVVIDDIVQFDFSIKKIDNLFKSFVTAMVNYDFKNQSSFFEQKTKDEILNGYKQLFDNTRYSTGIMYSTSYGIGIWNILIPKAWIDKSEQLIKSKLKEMNIEYETEYSEAFWVLRYVFHGNYIDHNNILKQIA